jgi:hypothetical protein
VRIGDRPNRDTVFASQGEFDRDRIGYILQNAHGDRRIAAKDCDPQSLGAGFAANFKVFSGFEVFQMIGTKRGEVFDLWTVSDIKIEPPGREGTQTEEREPGQLGGYSRTH